MRLGTVLSWVVMYTPLLASFLAAILYIDVIQGVSAIHDVSASSSGEYEENSIPVENNDLYMKVTAHDSGDGSTVMSEFPSCMHMFGVIKVANTHKTEKLIIHNIETSQAVPEEVPQLQGSAFGERKVTILPGRSVKLQFSFFPQFPSRHHKLRRQSAASLPLVHDTNNDDEEEEEEERICDHSVHMSRDSVMDVASILKIDPMEVGRMQVHNVETQVKVVSSRGNYWTQFHNSAVRSNPFHLPHTIVFERDGYVHSDMINVDRDRAEYRKASKKETVAYEYDIYIDNPSDQHDMSILDFYSSKPQFVEVLYHHQSGKGSEQEEGYYRFNNCGLTPLDILHCNSPISLESAGPPVLPLGAKTVYIGTIQLKKDLISDGGLLEDIDELFLGYIYIRIEHKSTLLMAIALDYVSDGANYDDQSFDCGGHDDIVEDEAVDGIVHNDSESLDVVFRDQEALDNSSDEKDVRNLEGSLDECDVNIINEPISVSQGPRAFATKSRQFVVQVPQTRKDSPRRSHLNFGYITGDKEERTLYVTVKNTGDTPIRLMHQSIIFKKVDELEVSTVMSVMESYKRSEIKIPPNESLQDAVKISLKSYLLSGYCENKCDLFGTVILRFGPSWMSYYDWMYAINDDPLTWERLSVELPFVTRIMHGYLEYDASTIFFPAQVDRNSLQISAMCQRSFHRNIFFRNMFSVPLTFRRIKVQGLDQESEYLSPKFCDDHFSVVSVRASNESNPGEGWDKIGLLYKYPENDNDELRFMKDPKKCFLEVFTVEAGIFHIPLWIYKSEVKAHVEEAATPIDCQKSEGNSLALTGMNCLHAIRKANHFESVVNLINRESEDRRGDHGANGKFSEGQWIADMERYFLSLSADAGSRVTSVDPIVLSYGAIAAGTTKSRQIFLSNRNPLSINITVEVPACEGMEIIITGVAKSDINKTIYDDSIDSQDSKIESIHLMGSSDTIFRTAKNFYGISPPTILDSILNKLLGTESSNLLGTVNATSYQRKMAILQAQSPPDFLNDTLRKAFKSNYVGPLLVTLDDDMAYNLNNVERNIEAVSSWTVPPGGVAAFDIIIRAPSTSALLNRNYADVLSSGILLKTNLGQLIPVVSTYRALSGHLLMSPLQEVHPQDNITSFRVPFTIGHKSQMLDTSKSENEDLVDVRVVNNFSTAVLVKEILSCNRFFRFDTGFGVLPIFIKTGESFAASISATVDCSGHSIYKDGSYPSFYKCALELLEEGASAVDIGCRTNFGELKSESTKQSLRTRSDDAVKIRAIDTLKEVIGFMDIKYGANGTDDSKKVLNRAKSINEMTHSKDKNNAGLIVVEKVQKEWALLAKLGMNTIQGIVQAQFEFVDNESKENSTMTSVVPSAVLEAALTLPRLSPRTNKFESTPVGEISTMYIPVKNPTGHPVVMRIIGDRNAHFYIHSPKQKDSWWTGGAYYIPDDCGGTFLQSQQNVTVNSIGGALFGLFSPSLHSITAVLQSCSMGYCGFNISQYVKNKPMKGGKNQRNINPIGASSALGFCLTGRFCDEGGNIMKRPANSTGRDLDYFAVSEADMNELVLPPYGSMQLGPFYFRPHSKGAFSGFLLLENSLTGYEALRFNGIGSGGNIAFFDGQNSTSIELRNGKSALVLEGGHTTIKILVGNMGGLDVEVLSVYLEFPTVSLRDNNRDYKVCRARGFTLSECNCQYGRKECGSKSFVLKSTSSKVVHIYHQNDCAFRSKHVNLVVEYKSRNGPSRIKKAELMIVYETNDADILSCSAEANLLFSFLERRGGMTKAMGTKVFLNFCSMLLSIVIFVALLWDMISSSMRKFAAMAKFRASVNTFYRKHKSRRTGYKNWCSAYRCLACADPTSFELTQLGREQTRQMLLNTYRKECMIRPHCILPDGTFIRQRKRLSDSIDVGTSHKQMNCVSISWNDIVFSNCMLFKKVEVTDNVPVLPSGLNWRFMSGIRNVRIKSPLTSQSPTCLKQQITVQQNKMKSKEEENPDSYDKIVSIPETSAPISNESRVESIPPVVSVEQDRMVTKYPLSGEGKVTRRSLEMHPKTSDHIVPEDVLFTIPYAANQTVTYHSSDGYMESDNFQAATVEETYPENRTVYESIKGGTESDNFEAATSEGTKQNNEDSTTRKSTIYSKSATEVTDFAEKTPPNVTGTNVEKNATLPVDSCYTMTDSHDSNIGLEEGTITFDSNQSEAKYVSTVCNTTHDSDARSANQPPTFSTMATDISTEPMGESVDERCDQTPALRHEEIENEAQHETTKRSYPGRRSRNRGRRKRKSKRSYQENSFDSREGSPQRLIEAERCCENQIGETSKSSLLLSKPRHSFATNEHVHHNTAASIRPPPGLAPPPGFGDSPDVLTENVQTASANGVKSDLEHNAISTSALWATTLDDNNMDSLNLLNSDDTNTMENNLFSVSQDETSQIANVMSFFNFLDESYDHLDGDPDENEDTSDHRQPPKKDAGHEAMPLYGNLNPEFTSNLWSESSYVASRPLSLGFNAENQQEKWKEENVTFPPLLTPDIILGRPADKDENEKNDYDTFDADAFFSGLLE